MNRRLKATQRSGVGSGSAGARAVAAGALVVLCAATAAPFALAMPPQPPPATLVVLVIDPSGAVVPGASVSVTGGPAIAREGLSDTGGSVAFTALPPGTYQIRVEISGFEMVSAATVVLNGRDRRITVKLKLAKLQQSVTVSGAEGRAVAGGSPFNRILTPLEIAQLPDDPVAMEEVLRQMAGPGATILVDGFRRAMLPAKSAIALITIKWADLSAETHVPSSVVIDIITTPGGEVLEGNGSLSFQPRGLTAADPFSSRPTSTTSSASLMASGPIWKGHTSFMLYARVARRVSPTGVTARVPVTVPGIVDARDAVSQDGTVDWQVTHQLGPAAFLRFGGTSLVGSGRNQGVGGLSLPERGYSTSRWDHAVRVSLIAGRDAKRFNQLRLWFRSSRESWHPYSDTPALFVAGAFVGGGAQRFGERRVGELAIEDDFDVVLGSHALRFGGAIERQWADSRESANAGGTYTFSSLADFERSAPLQFTRRVGDPRFVWATTQGGVYLQDNFRIGERLSMGAGIRWEAQSDVSGWFYPAPRVRLSWSPRSHSRTTVKGGIGWYYDWVDAEVSAQVRKLDGLRQFDQLIVHPDYPAVALEQMSVVPPNRLEFAPGIALPRLFRAAIACEQQLGNATLNVTVEDVRSVNGLRGRNVNAPGPDGLRPNPAFGNVTSIESTKRSWTRAVRVEARTKGMGRSLVSLSYELRWAKDNADGPLSLPADGLRPDADWGPSAGDVRHRAVAFVFMPIAPRVIATAIVVAASGTPYTITTGTDDNGDTIVNDRPTGVGRNSMRGAPAVSADARVMWQVIGEAPAPASATGTATSSGRRRRLSVVVAVQNLFNRTNPIGYVGVVGSPLFGKPVAAQSMRRLDAGLSFSF